MTTQNKITLFIVTVLIVIAIFWLDGQKVHMAPGSISTTSVALGNATGTPQDIMIIRANKAAKYPKAVEIVDPAGFVNTPNNRPIKIADYIGKDIILIDFMTYSCINCQRTFPYTTAWYSKYKDKGLIIIGIHTPEFEFEKVYDNVKKEIARFGITYPVVLDNNYGTWTAYANQYWPNEYLIDIDGYVVENHIGEGGYDTTEMKIKELIKERDLRLGIPYNLDSSIVNPLGAVTSIQTQSPETYFGSKRNEYFGNGTPGVAGSKIYTLPESFNTNMFYLSGMWSINPEYIESQSSEANLVYRYNAKNVYFVASAERRTRLSIMLDGKPIPVNMRGSDVHEIGSMTYIDVDTARLYNVISSDFMEEHLLQLSSLIPGLKAFTFTFG